MYLYTHSLRLTAHIFPVVANVHTKSIRKQMKSINIDEV